MASDQTSVEPDAQLLDVVADLVGRWGYDGLQVREVATRARVSTRTIYQRYGNREQLIVAALQRWMHKRRIDPLATVEIPSTGSVYERLMPIYRMSFASWEGHPQMLIAFYRAAAEASGKTLMQPGAEALRMTSLRALHGFDPAQANALIDVLEDVIYGLASRLSSGEITIKDIVPGIERALRLLNPSPPA